MYQSKEQSHEVDEGKLFSEGKSPHKYIADGRTNDGEWYQKLNPFGGIMYYIQYTQCQGDGMTDGECGNQYQYLSPVGWLVAKT